MKTIKLTLLTLVSVLLFSCEKEDCNCGVVANDGIEQTSHQPCYWIEIRNHCSGNKKRFCFDQDFWMQAHIGTNFCVSGETQW